MADNTDLIAKLSALTVTESGELVTMLEDAWGVKAPRVSSGGVLASNFGAPAPTVMAKTEFDVVLTSAGEKKIQVIKVLREICGLPLQEAKTTVDAKLPFTVKEGVPKAEAEALQAKFQAEGGKVEIR